MPHLVRLKSLSALDAGDFQDAVYNSSSGLWEAAGWVEYAESLAKSETTSTTYQEKVTLTTSANMPAGTYRMSWHTVWTSGTGYSISVRIRIGATTEIEYQTRSSTHQINNQPSKFGSKLIAFSAGSETVDLYFKRTGGSGSDDVDVSNSNIMLERVGV